MYDLRYFTRGEILRYKEKYDKYIADSLIEWHNDEWTIDKDGELKPREKIGDDKPIDVATISTSYPLEDIKTNIWTMDPGTE
jgi:hypothetical protein